jgi:hypothetical protein
METQGLQTVTERVCVDVSYFKGKISVTFLYIIIPNMHCERQAYGYQTSI